jgi:iron complex transport system permease protein
VSAPADTVDALRSTPLRATGSSGRAWRSLGLLASVGVLAFIVLLSLRVGSVPLSWSTVLDAFTAYDPTSNEHLIVRTLRLPRTIIGLGVGAALAVAGVAMQATTRNALADPGIFGINAGASFAIVTAVYALGVVSPTMYVWFAFAGAIGASVLVYVVAAAGRTRTTPVKLALSGAVVAALLASWTSALLVLNQRTLDEVRFWLAGSLAGRDLAVFWQVAPFLVVGLVAVIALTRHLDAITLGDQVAAGLGQRTGLVRVGVGIAVVLLTGSAVAAAGPIGFVGLAVPHAVRTVVGPSHRWLLPYTVVWGPVLLLSADIVGRIAARPSEIQVGIVTAIVGAPFLIHLVRRRRLAEL